MVVGPTPPRCSTGRSASRSCSDRAPAAADRHPHRRRRSTATATTTAARSTSPRASARARRAARCWSRARRRRSPARTSTFERDRRGRLKGFDESTELFLAPARSDERGRRAYRLAMRPTASCAGRRGCCRPARPVRRAALRRARLGLPARPRGAARRRGGGRALHVNYGLRDDADEDERALRRAVRAARRARSTSQRPRPPEGAGTCRPGRATCATPPRRGCARRAAPRRRRPHRRPTRSRPSSTGSPPRPAAARCSGMAAREGRLVRPLLACHARGDRRPTARSAGWRGARTRPTRRPATRATASAHGLVPALRGVHPAAEANVLRTAELLRDEAAVLDARVDDALAGRGRRSPSRAAWRALPPALAPARRAAARRRRGWAARPGRGSPRRRDRGAAPHRHGELDVGGGRARRRRARRAARRARPPTALTRRAREGSGGGAA